MSHVWCLIISIPDRCLLHYSKLYRQIVCIPMVPNCAPLVSDLFLLCNERDFRLSQSDNNQDIVIETFNSTSRYLDHLLNFDNHYFERMVNLI